MSQLEHVVIASVPIANGATVSSAFRLKGAKYVAIETPATFTGTTVTFEALSALDNSIWVGVRDTAGNLVTITVSETVAYISALDGVDLEAILAVAGEGQLVNLRLLVSAQGAARVCAVHYAYEGS